MLDGFIGSDLFYLLFGLSYLFLVYMVYVYMKELENISFETNRLNMRIDILKERTDLINGMINSIERKQDKPLRQSIIGKTVPSSDFKGEGVGTLFINTSKNEVYCLISIANNKANWVRLVYELNQQEKK